MAYFANSTSSRWNADVSELTSSWPSKFSKVKLTLTLTPSRTTGAHLPITARTKPSPTQERCLLSSGCEIEQTSCTSSLATLSLYLQKAAGPSMVRNLPCSTCVTSLTIFSILLPQTIYVFPYPQSPTSLCGYYWPSRTFLLFINK